MYEYDQSQSFNVGVAQECSLEAALVLKELMYWENRGSREDGWIYKSYAEMLEHFPFLNEYQLRKAYQTLKNHGWIKTKIMQVEGAPTFHYQISKHLHPVSLKIEESMDSLKIKESTYIHSRTHSSAEKNNAPKEKKELDDFRDNDPLYEKEMADSLFSSLVELLGFPRARLSTERRKKLKVRLKSFTQNELVRAAKAIRANEYMQGKNDGKVRYGTIDYLLRNDEKVEQWLAQDTDENNGVTIENQDQKVREFMGDMRDGAQ